MKPAMRAGWEILEAHSEADWARCYPVMAELRPHLSERAFLEQVARQAAQGYRLAGLSDDGVIRAAAGYRFQEMLAHGPILYVDDLVTAAAGRSNGYGAALFEWLMATARAAGCAKFQLDSGVQRFRAHRFYFREGMHISSYHFNLELDPQPPR